MFAVDLERFGMILFSPVVPDERLRREIVEELGGKIVEGVTLTESPDVNDWPEGTLAPDAVLAVSRSDPSHYEVIKYRQDVEPRGFRVVGRNYGLIGSESGWETFLESLRSLSAIAANATGVEGPDSPEAL